MLRMALAILWGHLTGLPTLRYLSLFLQETPEGMEMVHDYALSCLEDCPQDVTSILKRMLSIMDISIEDFSPIPGRALDAKQQRLKALLIELFPGDSQ